MGKESIVSNLKILELLLLYDTDTRNYLLYSKIINDVLIELRAS